MSLHNYCRYSLNGIAHPPVNFFLFTGKELSSFGSWKIGKNHTIYDLKKLQWCLEKLLDDERLETIKSFNDMEVHPSHLLEEVISALS